MTSPSPSIPHAQGVRGQPARRTRRPRLSWLRALPLLARYIIRTMRWATLIAGCLASLAVFTILVRLTHHDQATFWLDQGTIRDSLLPATAALAVPLAGRQDLYRAAIDQIEAILDGGDRRDMLCALQQRFCRCHLVPICRLEQAVLGTEVGDTA